jgi:hypothetical protein
MVSVLLLLLLGHKVSPDDSVESLILSQLRSIFVAFSRKEHPR